MVSVLLIFAFVMSLVINFFERTIYGNERAVRDEHVDSKVANEPEKAI